MQQVDAKNKNHARMNPNEMALNKPILREANQKLKAMSQYGDSVKSGV
jgi:hypothetical protein